ncbi:GlxA family transcriptional regulator [Paenirhodobacter populi]|nr:helix-turn-helix domain-containing protein [Sinirhodobacter populi]
MPNSPRPVEILAFPDVQLLDVAGPLQVFATANDQLAQSGGAPAYAIRVVAAAARVRTTAGLDLAAEPFGPENAPLDTLVVAGGRGVNAAMESGELIGWIARRSGSARRIASVCSGAFLLARAGLLDGRRAVTHWHRCAEFSRLFPTVRLDPDPIYVRDGAVWTSAGITAGIDLALALVEEDLGRALALAVARELVVFLKRPGGQAQFSTMLALQEGDGRFDRLHAWIMENLRGDLSLPALAEQTHMSPRSFSRRYRQVTGRTPARAVEQIRVEAARRMLEDRVSVAQTALRCGFGSEETMRRSFLRILAVGPQAYRERF